MVLAVLGLLVQLVSVVCFMLVLLHAFSRSLGTGVMVIPVYKLYYGFSQFEHRRKGLVLAGWIGLFPLGIVLRTLAPGPVGAGS
jgi:translocator protein